MKFYEAARERVRLATELRHQLVRVQDYVPGEDPRLDERITKIQKAITFWKTILDELKEKQIREYQ
jgi:hypothetical protein